MSAMQLLEATYADISTIAEYVNNLISPRRIHIKYLNSKSSHNEKKNPTFYIARTPTFSEYAQEDLSRERSRLRKASLSSSSTQQELVQRAITILCNRQMKSNSYAKKMRFTGASSADTIEKRENYALDLRNVLSLGYGTPTGHRVSNNSNVVDSPAIANFYPNTLVNVLQSKFWALILKSIGDEIMLHILLECSIFQCLENGCFMQLTGPPLSVVSSILQKRRFLLKNTIYIPRISIFYSKTHPRKSGLSKYHFIRTLPSFTGGNCEFVNPASRTKAIQLVHKHFALASRNRVGKKHKHSFKRLSKGYIGVVSQMQEIMKNHLSCDYSRLLNKYCPISSLPTQTWKDLCQKNINNETEELESTLARLTKMNTPFDDVVQYIWNVLKELLPRNFFGSNRNKNVFRSKLKYFVECSRYDVVRLQQLTMSIKPSEMDWLDVRKGNKILENVQKEVPSTNETRLKLLHLFVKFIYTEIVIPILRHDFYVTETESSFQRVGYYRRSVWNRIRSIATKKLERENILQAQTVASKSTISNNSPSVILRFVPKKRTVRPIMNMSRRNKRKKSAPVQRGLSMNQLLKNTYKALKYETERNPSLLGAAVYGYDDVYERLKPFLYENKNRKLYFAALDIKTCYDSISPKRCFSIVENVFREAEYVFQRYSVVHPEPADKSVRVEYIHKANALGNGRQFLQLSNELAKSKRSAVFTDNVVYRSEEKEQLTRILKDHIFNNVVSVGPGRSYLQRHGIPQGSILSTLMCNLYYGNMEKTQFPYIFGQPPGTKVCVNDPVGAEKFREDPGVSDEKLTSHSREKHSVLLRLVDDYLLVTKDKDIAERFVKTMHSGIPEYFCNVKPSKTKISFECHLNERDAIKIPDGGKLAWCGLLIDTGSYEILGDYEKYQQVHLKYAVSSVFTGVELLKKVRAFLKPKCHALLFDGDLNSPEVVRLNALHMYLVAAIKFHVLVQKLPQQPLKNPDFFFHVIEDSCRYGVWLINDRCKKFDGKSGMANEEIICIGLHGFFTVLSRKRNRYTSVIEKLKHRMTRCNNRCRKDPSINFKQTIGILHTEKHKFILNQMKW